MQWELPQKKVTSDMTYMYSKSIMYAANDEDERINSVKDTYLLNVA